MKNRHRYRKKPAWPAVGAVALGAVAAPALAFVGFVTIAGREKVSVSIYNGEDLTLVRDVRRVVMKQGPNDLRYQWANTLIDPTSLRPFPPAGVVLKDTTYPLNEGQSLVWRFNAAKQTAGSLAIQYFTSGLSWRADHIATLTGPGKARLETWVRVNNYSGEDFDNTHFRLVVGQVKLTERIRELAERYMNEARDYDKREESKSMMYEMEAAVEEADEGAYDMMMDGKGVGGSLATGSSTEKAVARQSLSELHLYDIEGTENVPNGGGRRMRAFSYADVAVKDVYRCNDPGESSPAQRVFSFKNTKDNHMGGQPLPEGTLQLFKAGGDGLSYEGRGETPYTPMGEEAEIPLGYPQGVGCKALVKNVWREDIQKDELGRIKGWADMAQWQVSLINGSGENASFEMRQHHDNPFSTTLKEGEKEDLRTLLVKSTVPPRGKKTFTYTVKVLRGSLAEGSGKGK